MKLCRRCSLWCPPCRQITNKRTRCCSPQQVKSRWWRQAAVTTTARSALPLSSARTHAVLQSMPCPIDVTVQGVSGPRLRKQTLGIARWTDQRPALHAALRAIWAHAKITIVELATVSLRIGLSQQQRALQSRSPCRAASLARSRLKQHCLRMSYGRPRCPSQGHLTLHRSRT